MRPVLLAALCLAVAASGAAASGAFIQCGGTMDCEKHSACADAPWTDVKCLPGFGCQRQSAAKWQCTNDPVAVREAKAAAEDAAAAEKAGGPIRTRVYPGITIGDRSPGPATATCNCVDIGLNDPACFKGITTYCTSTSPKPNMAVCEAFSGFYNMQNMTAGKVVATFLVDVCKVTVPPSPSACACIEGPAMPGCKAATLNACLLGNSMCESLAFGSEADMASQESFAKYAGAQCGGAMAAAEVGMNFTGMTSQVFMTKYARGAAATLAVVSGQPITSIILLPVRQIKVGSLVPAGGATGRRRLAQANVRVVEKVLAKFQVRSSPQEAPAVLARLELAGADGGEALFRALAANGVPLRPSYSIQNGPPLVGAVPKRTLTYARPTPLDQAEIVGIAVGSAAGVLLVAALVTFMVVQKRRDRRRWAEAQARKAADAKAAAAQGGGGGGGGAKVVDVHSTAAGSAAK